MRKKSQRTTFCSLTIRLQIQLQIINAQNKEKVDENDEGKVKNLNQKEPPKNVKKEELKINVNEANNLSVEPKEIKKEEEKSKSPFLLKKNLASPKMGMREGNL